MIVTTKGLKLIKIVISPMEQMPNFSVLGVKSLWIWLHAELILALGPSFKDENTDTCWVTAAGEHPERHPGGNEFSKFHIKEVIAVTRHGL